MGAHGFNLSGKHNWLLGQTLQTQPSSLPPKGPSRRFLSGLCHRECLPHTSFTTAALKGPCLCGPDKFLLLTKTLKTIKTINSLKALFLLGPYEEQSKGISNPVIPSKKHPLPRQQNPPFVLGRETVKFTSCRAVGHSPQSRSWQQCCACRQDWLLSFLEASLAGGSPAQVLPSEMHLWPQGSCTGGCRALP